MSQPTPAQLDALLKFAAAKLGTTPHQLAATVSNGGIDSLTDSLSDSNKQRLQALLSDRSQMEALLRSEAFREVLRRYT